MFWGDQGTGQIGRAKMDGQDVVILLQENIHWPNQLAVDYGKR